MEKPVTLPHIFLMPTTNCVASCHYCFSPVSQHRMDDDTLERTVAWIKATADALYEENRDKLNPERMPQLKITYHGGEALMMGKAFMKKSLEMIDAMDIPFPKRIGIQSNLWLLDQEYCDMFKQYDMSVGTSLDGPEGINDSQRGDGYFKKTMKGVDLLRKNGIDVACICTFTKTSARYYKEIFNFFASENMHFTFSMVQPTMDKAFNAQMSLSNQEQAELVNNLTQLYLQDLNKIRVQALDVHLLSLTARIAGGVVLGNCIGDQIAIGPDGGVYNCQMFVGHENYKWGSVQGTRSLADIMKGSPWLAFKEWHASQKQNCKGCSYSDLCSGGCIYNAIMSNNEVLDTNRKDPACTAYKDTLNTINALQLNAMALTEQGGDRSGRHTEQELIALQSFRGFLKAYWHRRSS